MAEVLATLQSVLAALHGLDKASFFFEIARQNILHQVVRIAALLSGGVCQLRFQLPRDVHFHFVGSFSENTLLRLPRRAWRFANRRGGNAAAPWRCKVWCFVIASASSGLPMKRRSAKRLNSSPCNPFLVSSVF